jgi:hypothetical protein
MNRTSHSTAFRIGENQRTVLSTGCATRAPCDRRMLKAAVFGSTSAITKISTVITSVA